MPLKHAIYDDANSGVPDTTAPTCAFLALIIPLTGAVIRPHY
ncbi:hypothetical protein EJK50_0103 [Moraxella catarrhalis]|nr:hypothetical protein EJK50_0103 [Moraxella catarrhalis]